MDARRIAAAGFSMGGYRAWQTAALSDSVAAATVSVCWMTGLKEMMVPGNNALRGQSAFHMLHPGLARYLDLPDVASIAAPRPMLFLGGDGTTCSPPRACAPPTTGCAPSGTPGGAADRLRTETWPDVGHAFPRRMQDAAFRWLESATATPICCHRPSTTDAGPAG